MILICTKYIPVAPNVAITSVEVEDTTMKLKWSFSVDMFLRKRATVDRQVCLKLIFSTNLTINLKHYKCLLIYHIKSCKILKYKLIFHKCGRETVQAYTTAK